MPNESVGPDAVYGHALWLLAEIDLVRLEMGRPRDARPEMRVANVAPRENYFEAVASFRKADRLCFERTGEEALLPHPPAVGELTPGHVREVVDAAVQRLQQVKARLGIAEQSPAPAAVAGKQPTDVCGLLFRANRQLNLLLDQPFSPNDVYQLVTLAIGYAARLLGHVGGIPPALPAFERKKRPADVYRRLHRVLGKIGTITTRSGLTMLELGEVPYSDDELAPSDVYDLASLAISELVFLHSRVPALSAPTVSEFYEVGHKLPAHAFQRVGLLEAYIDAIAQAVEKRPSALRT
jgi:hypothetical protein